MCTSITEHAEIMGHGRGVVEWIALTRANVCYDHPISAPLEHALIIDFANEAAGPGARVVVELSVDSARALLRAIETALATGETQLGAAAAQHSSAR